MILLTLAVAAAAAVPTLSQAGEPPSESVCPGFTTGHLSPAGSYTAPEGKLIIAVCVKAGSDVQGDGPEITNYDPPVSSVTISHSSGKDVSHFSVLLIDEPGPTTTTSTTTTLPQCPDPPCVPDTQGNTTTTSTSVQTTSTSSSTSSTVSTPTTVPSTSTTSSTLPASSSSTSTTSTTLPETFQFGAAATVCRAEVPTIVIEFQNTFPDLAGQTGTLTMEDVNGNVVSTQPLVYQPGTTVELLYPGTSVNADGSIDDVPGWILTDDGLWVRDPSDEFLRDGISLTYTVNPTAGPVLITYPPESSACANPDNPPVPPVPPAPPGSLPPTA